MTVPARLRSVLASKPLSKIISAAFPRGIPSRAGRISVRNQAIDETTAAELFFRLYERQSGFALIRDTMLAGYDVVQVGSRNRRHGFGCVASSGWISPKLVCLEANAGLLPTLRANLNRPSGATNVWVVYGALGYTDVQVKFIQSDAHMKSRVDLSRADGVDVPTYTLSALLELSGVEQLLLISDVEGAEAAMLTQDKEALARCQQMIIELHGSTSPKSRKWYALSRPSVSTLSRPEKPSSLSRGVHPKGVNKPLGRSRHTVTMIRNKDERTLSSLGLLTH